MLGPEDHRVALASDDPAIRRRLGSVGRPLPTLEVEIRDADGAPVAAGERPARSACAASRSPASTSARADVLRRRLVPHPRLRRRSTSDGFLYLEGRLDDVIVRGAENLSPGEIEDVLVAHPSVAEAAVVGVPDDEWGEKVVAAVVAVDGEVASEAELQAWVKERLRSSKIPAHVLGCASLPYNETGKLLRRELRVRLAEQFGA